MSKICSIKELRVICQTAKGNRTEWQYIIHRKLSIYITWCLLHTPIKANSVTILSFIAGCLGAICLIFCTQWDLVLGFIFFYLYFILDKVDGEIARYRNERSLTGICLDYIGHMIVPPLVPISVGGYLAHQFNFPYFWLIGALALLGCLFVRCSSYIPNIMTLANYGKQFDLFEKLIVNSNDDVVDRVFLVKSNSFRFLIRWLVDCFSYSGYYWTNLFVFLVLHIVHMVTGKAKYYLISFFIITCLYQLISVMTAIIHLVKNVDSKVVNSLTEITKFNLNHRNDILQSDSEV